MGMRLSTLSFKLDSLDLPYKIDVVNYQTIKDQAVLDHISSTRSYK